MNKIKIGIIGVGNCASSLIQGVSYYSNPKHNESDGMMRNDIGGYTAKDIEFVIGFDVDSRKVGVQLKDAIFAKPNCTMVLESNITSCKDGALVYATPVLDGVAEHMKKYPEDEAFRVNEDVNSLNKEEIIALLKEHEVDMLINYLPVGSQMATEFWANICLETKTPFINCIPVFIASNPEWEQKFIDAGVPLIGDDMKSEFGASILSQMIQELAFSRGHKVKCHIQRNVGGNTDFLNMEDKTRLASKKISKENVIKSQNTIRGISTEGSFLHAGPSEYIRYYGDNKVANFRIEMEGFMGAPVILDAQLSVQDSPNSAGVVIDAIRYLKVASELGLVGALRGPSAWTQKTPPMQMTGEAAQKECELLSNRVLSDLNNHK